MNYSNFTIDEFLEDAYFKKWVYAPEQGSNQYWEKFLLLHPEKAEIVEHARLVLLNIEADIANNYPEPQQISRMWDQIKLDIHENKKPVYSLSNRTIFISSVAAAMAVIMLTWLFKPYDQQSKNTYQSLVTNSTKTLIEKDNTSSKTIKINLPDNSQIVLKPNSKISYPAEFNKEEAREVYLSGEAFFNVSKNTKRPFYVYTNDLITKVLGTSFNIKTYENCSNLEVEVKTGKVSVFHRDELQKDKKVKELLTTGTILTPNQKVKYTGELKSLTKLIVDHPEVIVSSISAAPINEFIDKPVSSIFNNLQEAYGIDIEYNSKLYGDCLLTASFSNESLFEKIDLICKGIEAKYHVENARIIISGRGCHE